VAASNDLNTANDALDVAVDVAAAATVPSGSSTAKSGGGAFEWLTLALIGWCLARKFREKRQPAR
jgi:hypothetical protein